MNPKSTIEVLIPDFQGSIEAVEIITNNFPEVINHNVETVPRLYPLIRPKAEYRRSLKVLRTVKSLNSQILTKSGLMLGLGENRDEIENVMEQLRTAECDFLTIGQYMAPSRKHYPVVRYVTPDEFEEHERLGNRMGFRYVASGPFVRSSFKSAEMFASKHATKAITAT